MQREESRVVLTNHSVGRFHERFRPALDLIEARKELEQLIAFGAIADSPPEWVARTAAQEADAYLIVGEDFVLPLAASGPVGELVAKTCLARGGLSEASRERRNAHKRRRRADRRAKRQRR